MATQAIIAQGTLLKRGDGVAPPGETFTTIAEVLDITGPGLSMETVDATSHDSAGWREYIAGMKDGGEVAFEVNFQPDNSSHDNTAGILKDMTDSTLRNFELVFPTSTPTTWSFSGYVTLFEPSMPASGSDRLTASITIKLSGAPTLA